jgi:hypothetical protein
MRMKLEDWKLIALMLVVASLTAATFENPGTSVWRHRSRKIRQTSGSDSINCEKESEDSNKYPVCYGYNACHVRELLFSPRFATRSAVGIIAVGFWSLARH